MLALGACGGGGSGNEGSDNEYPHEARPNFIDACVVQRGATRSVCQCAFDKIQARLTYAEFKRADDAARLGRQMDAKARSAFSAAVTDCTG